MERGLIVIAVVMLAVFALDRLRHRRALRARDSWHCFKCGVELHAGGTHERIAVAGSGPFTHARACPRCALRDRTIQRVVWALLVALFVATTLVLYLE